MLELARIYVVDVDQPKALALAMLMDVAEYDRDAETAAEAEFLAASTTAAPVIRCRPRITTWKPPYWRRTTAS